MKHTLLLIITICFQLLLTIIGFVHQSFYLLFAIFIMNLVLLAFIISQPKWKLGALILIAIFIMNLIYVLNIVIFQFYVILHGILVLLLLLIGLGAMLLAHQIKALDYVPDEYEEFEKEVFPKKRKEQPTAHKGPEIKTYVQVKDIIHTADCSIIKDVDEKYKSYIGSRRYAETLKARGCGECKPFA